MALRNHKNIHSSRIIYPLQIREINCGIRQNAQNVLSELLVKYIKSPRYTTTFHFIICVFLETKKEFNIPELTLIKTF